MKKRMILVVLMLLVIGGAALAQDATPEALGAHTFCGDLSDADCQLVTGAQQATMGLSSASVDLAATLNIRNIPDAPFNALNFQLSGNGAYHVDADALSRLQSYQASPEAMLQNLQDTPQIIEDLVNSFQGQLNLTLTLPQELVRQASSSQQRIPETLSVELRLVNGVAYINLASLAESMPNAGVPSGWYGLELARLLRSVMEASLRQMEQQGGAAGALPPGFDLSSISRFTDPETLKEFVTIERLADSEIGGESVAAFRTTVDYNAFFSSPAFQDLMRQQMDSSGSTMSQADREQAMQIMREMFKGLTFESTEYVDLQSSFVRRQEMHFNWDLQSVMNATAAGSGSQSNQPAPVVDFTFTLNYADFNSAPTIAAPANAQVITAEQAMGMLFGSMMGGNTGTSPGGTGSSSSGTGGNGALEPTPEVTPGM